MSYLVSNYLTLGHPIEYFGDYRDWFMLEEDRKKIIKNFRHSYYLTIFFYPHELPIGVAKENNPFFKTRISCDLATFKLPIHMKAPRLGGFLKYSIRPDLATLFLLPIYKNEQDIEQSYERTTYFLNISVQKFEYPSLECYNIVHSLICQNQTVFSFNKY